MRIGFYLLVVFSCFGLDLASHGAPAVPVSPPGLPALPPGEAARTSVPLGQASAASPVGAKKSSFPVATPAVAAQGPAALVWDSMSKEYHASAGEESAPFKFAVTNSSSQEVTINSVRTSCGCTVAKLPSTPWKLAPGDGGTVEATVDLRGKFGTLSKFVSVDTSEGPKTLNIKVVIAQGQPVTAGGDARARNMQAALGDRQAVFKNDCASCHVAPTVGKTGEPLFQTACGICHEDSHRATMVPDLHALKTPPTREYWEHWITLGKPATLMPAFAQTEGGPLSPDQIHSLVDYLTDHFPQHPQTAGLIPNPVK